MLGVVRGGAYCVRQGGGDPGTTTRNSGIGGLLLPVIYIAFAFGVVTPAVIIAILSPNRPTTVVVTGCPGL